MEHQVQTALKSNQTSCSFTASTATTDELNYAEFAKGGLILNAVTTAATLSFWGGNVSGGTFLQIYDASNAAKAQGIAINRAYVIPTECQGFPYLKITTDTGTASGFFTRKS